MTLQRPPGLLAGFHALGADAGVPALVHAGEQWAPRTFAIPTHRHEQWELYLQASGESRWRAEEWVYEVRENALFLAPPGVEHELLTPTHAKHHFFYAAIDIDALQHRLPDLPKAWRRRDVVLIEDAGSLTAPFRQLMRELSLELPYQAAGLRIALDALILETSRLLVSPSRAAGAGGYLHPAVTHARQLLDQHPGRDWKIADLARLAGLSSGHLAERFTQDIGVPPHVYLLDRRIAAAEELLAATDLSITEIALELGFSSSQYFATVFRRLRGSTPRDYRRQRMR